MVFLLSLLLPPPHCLYLQTLVSIKTAANFYSPAEKNVSLLSHESFGMASHLLWLGHLSPDQSLWPRTDNTWLVRHKSHAQPGSVTRDKCNEGRRGSSLKQSQVPLPEQKFWVTKLQMSITEFKGGGNLKNKWCTNRMECSWEVQ